MSGNSGGKTRLTGSFFLPPRKYGSLLVLHDYMECDQTREFVGQFNHPEHVFDISFIRKHLPAAVGVAKHHVVGEKC